MKLQLIDVDHQTVLEPVNLIFGEISVFPENKTDENIEVAGYILIPETQEEQSYFENTLENAEPLIPLPSQVRLYPGDCFKLRIKLHGSLSPFPACINCEFFMDSNAGIYACNALQTPSVDPYKETSCPHWEAISRKERAARNEQLQQQVQRCFCDCPACRQRVEDIEGLRSLIQAIRQNGNSL